MNKNDYELFVTFYKSNLIKYCSENNLHIKKKSYETHYKIEKRFSTDRENSVLDFMIDIKDLYLGGYGNEYYGSKFVRYLLDNGNEQQREQVIKNEFNLFRYRDLALSSYNNPKDMGDIFRELSKYKVLKDYQWEGIIEDMQENCESKLYDTVIDIFLDGKKKEIKMKSNKIIINRMLNIVKDDKIYEKYNSLIPDNEINEDFFENLNIVCFDLNVSKTKLYSAVLLKNKDKYNDMHECLIDKLNEEKLKEKLDIVFIDGETKYKSSKYFRYICRMKEGGILQKEDVKLLIISFCKLYSQTVNNIEEGEREYEKIKKISPEMIYNSYLSYKLSKNTKENNNNKEKKIKI